MNPHVHESSLSSENKTNVRVYMKNSIKQDKQLYKPALMTVITVFEATFVIKQ